MEIVGSDALYVLSRLGNFAVDLPDADVLIQVSGKYGSRQEEAQRLGRILRPKSDGHTASFYTLVSLQTCDEDFARHRQLFLTEQGYNYRIEVQKDVESAIDKFLVKLLMQT